MTRHDAIREQIAKCRRMMIPAMVLALVGFVATVITGVTVGGGVSAVAGLVTFAAFLVWVSAFIGISHTVRCPSCHKRLGYLLVDPNYSKTFAPIGMPKDIPETVTECPYCHVDLEQEMTEQSSRHVPK